MKPDVRTFFHEPTFTAVHVVVDPATRTCAIIDSVLDYNEKSGCSCADHAELVARHVEDEGLTTAWVLETHVHADHLTAAAYLRDRLGGRIATGALVTEVQRAFKSVFNLDDDFRADGAQFEYLFDDGETFRVGEIEARVLHTPGHTPSCVTYVIGDAAFVGDTLFMPDYGTARCDFPGGDAAILYDSISRIYALPDETRLFLCHDYKAEGRDEFAWETTVREQRERNIQINESVDADAFIKWRRERDAGLDMPKLILPAIQVNMRAGHFPPPEANGVSYLKVPLNAF